MCAKIPENLPPSAISNDPSPPQALSGDFLRALFVTYLPYLPVMQVNSFLRHRWHYNHTNQSAETRSRFVTFFLHPWSGMALSHQTRPGNLRGSVDPVYKAFCRIWIVISRHLSVVIQTPSITTRSTQEKCYSTQAGCVKQTQVREKQRQSPSKTNSGLSNYLTGVRAHSIPK